MDMILAEKKSTPKAIDRFEYEFNQTNRGDRTQANA
jgi:hypothetical protein